MATRQVIVKGNPIQKEGIANEAITPGHLIEFIGGSAATATNLKKHATTSGNAQPRFAVEQDYIGGGLSKVYASGDQVFYVVARPGDEIYALLEANNNVGVGAPLESAGDGTLQLHSPASAGAAPVQKDSIVAYAKEAQNSGSVARITVEVA